jgi:hypothetical protein
VPGRDSPDDYFTTGLTVSFIAHLLVAGVFFISVLPGLGDFAEPIVYSISIEGGRTLGGQSQVPKEEKSQLAPMKAVASQPKVEEKVPEKTPEKVEEKKHVELKQLPGTSQVFLRKEDRAEEFFYAPTKAKKTATAAKKEEVKSFTHTLALDKITEGTETLQIKLFSNSTRTIQVGSTALVSLLDTSTTPVSTYAVTPSIAVVNEGVAVTSTVKTTNVATGTVLYWALSGTGIAAADFRVGALTRLPAAATLSGQRVRGTNAPRSPLPLAPFTYFPKTRRILGLALLQAGLFFSDGDAGRGQQRTGRSGASRGGGTA